MRLFIRHTWKIHTLIRKLKGSENNFVNFTGATFTLATQVYTTMHKSRLHQQVCHATWKSILSQIFFREKKLTTSNWENYICLCTHFDNKITPRFSLFVWDFPTLSQERRYFFICLYTRARCLWRGLYWKREDPENECLCVAALYARFGCCQLANHFDLFSRFDQFKGKGKSSYHVTFFIVLSKLCWL